MSRCCVSSGIFRPKSEIRAQGGLAISVNSTAFSTDFLAPAMALQLLQERRARFLAHKRFLTSPKGAAACHQAGEELTNHSGGVLESSTVLREFINSAQAATAGRQNEQTRQPLRRRGESVVREFLESAQAAVRGTEQKRNSADLAAGGESVVREFPNSLKPASAFSGCKSTRQI